MFIKLHWAYTQQEVVLNVAHITRFDRGGGWTWVRMAGDTSSFEVLETPDEIIKMMGVVGRPAGSD